jgi:putative transposase
MTATAYRAEMTLRLTIWEQVTGAASRPTTA